MNKEELKEVTRKTAEVAATIKKNKNGSDKMIVYLNDGIVYKSIKTTADNYGIKYSTLKKNLTTETSKSPLGHASCFCVVDGNKVRRSFQYYNFGDEVEYEPIVKSLSKTKEHSPLDRTVLGVGYLGVGKYTPKENLTEYKKWRGMLDRCYGNTEKRKKNYSDCIVAPEWHNFQNFCEWYKKQDTSWIPNGTIINLDKDLLCKDNKEYHPDKCIIVPQEINVFIIARDRDRGKYACGVTVDKRSGVFRAYVNIKGKVTYVGSFYTEEEARQAYLNAKKNEQ